jgi:hypothetical protein
MALSGDEYGQGGGELKTADQGRKMPCTEYNSTTVPKTALRGFL